MPSILTQNLVKDFGAGHPAVDDVTVALPHGEFICLLGPSGCGKTTTLRMVAGLEKPTSGSIRIGDVVVNDTQAGDFVPPEKRNLGFMFQSYALWPHMTVAQNILFGLEMKKADSGTKQRRLAELLKLLRIEGLEGRYVSELSGGQQQRVALARMLAVDPDLLLLDEPLSNLDASLRLEMRSELKRLHQNLGATVVFVTHDQLEAMTMATIIVVMNEGRIQQMASPMECYLQPANRFVAQFLGNPPMNIVEDAQQDPLGAHLVRAWLGHNPSAMGQRPVSVGFRPESVELAPGDGEGTVPAVLETVLPTGSEWILGLNILGVSTFALSSVPPPGEPGEELAVRIDPRRIHCFDRSGVRLLTDREKGTVASEGATNVD